MAFSVIQYEPENLALKQAWKPCQQCPEKFAEVEKTMIPPNHKILARIVWQIQWKVHC